MDIVSINHAKSIYAMMKFRVYGKNSYRIVRIEGSCEF